MNIIGALYLALCLLVTVCMGVPLERETLLSIEEPVALVLEDEPQQLIRVARGYGHGGGRFPGGFGGGYGGGGYPGGYGGGGYPGGFGGGGYPGGYGGFPSGGYGSASASSSAYASASSFGGGGGYYG